MDSKYDGDSTYHRTIKHMMIENLKRAWNDAGLRNMGFRHYKTAYPNLPKQEGCDACGIFVLTWLENWSSRNALQSVFMHDMVQDARIRFAVDILLSDHNIPMKEKDCQGFMKYELRDTFQKTHQWT
ncbi:hypothetical protein ACQJBY_017349 [Aegilops geniculata]